jgi:hypothetical protein
VAELHLLEITLKSPKQMIRDTDFNLTVQAKLLHNFGADLMSPINLLQSSCFFSSRKVATVNAARWNPLTGVMPMTVAHNESTFPWTMGNDFNVEVSAEISVPVDKCFDVTHLCIHVQNSSDYIETVVGGSVLCENIVPFLKCKHGKLLITIIFSVFTFPAS